MRMCERVRARVHAAHACTSAAQAQGTAEGRLTFRQEVEAGHCGVALHACAGASRGRAAAEREGRRRG